MIPWIHVVGWFYIPTFGLMVAVGLLTAAYILQADLNRRRTQLERLPGYEPLPDEGFFVIAIAGLCGIIGARLYHVLQTPDLLFANPKGVLLSREGFAWFGGFLGGTAALVVMARRLKIPLLEFFDMCSSAACVGYGIGRIGCLLSGDGDYGRATSLPWGMSFPNGLDPTPPKCMAWGLPADCRVHPTPLYEFFIWLAIGVLLWHMGTKSLRTPKAKGEIFAYYLILTGIARFLIEIIRINPRSFLGMSNAQAASALSILIGAVLLWRVKSQFHAPGKATG